jgi:hypothetical protein
MVHKRAAAIMKEFDLMSKDARQRINDGTPLTDKQRQTARYHRFKRAHFEEPT